jgi:hypothetical protein
MIITLFDKSEILASKEEVDKIVNAINRGVKLIAIRGNLINPSAIAKIENKGNDIDIKLLERPDHREKEAPNKELIRKARQTGNWRLLKKDD